MKTYGIIPARLHSSRLPRKLLLADTGKPLLQYAWEVASRARGLSEVIIFYMENADAHPPAGKPDEDGDYAVGGAEAAALAARMEEVVKALRG